MDKRIERIRDDIRRTEAKKREVEEYLKTLRMRERQLCDEEILKTMREMAGKGDVLEVLERVRNTDRVNENEKSKISELQTAGSDEESAVSLCKEREDNDEEK